MHSRGAWRAGFGAHSGLTTLLGPADFRPRPTPTARAARPWPQGPAPTAPLAQARRRPSMRRRPRPPPPPQGRARLRKGPDVRVDLRVVTDLDLASALASDVRDVVPPSPGPGRAADLRRTRPGSRGVGERPVGDVGGGVISHAGRHARRRRNRPGGSRGRGDGGVGLAWGEGRIGGRRVFS